MNLHVSIDLLSFKCLSGLLIKMLQDLMLDCLFMYVTAIEPFNSQLFYKQGTVFSGE